MMPHNEAEYMTATGSSLIALQKQSCARERSIYVWLSAQEGGQP
jgi:hypothetical protein